MARSVLSLAIFLVTASFSSAQVLNQKITCKNPRGKPVDWFVVYKLPKTKPVHGYIPLRGGEMAYFDSNTQGSWILLPSDIYLPKFNPIRETLAPIYGRTQDRDVAFLAYNDQLPETFKGTRGGHSKGILLAGRKPGDGVVWLQHSVPRFVEDLKQGYAYPDSGRENGQLFLCLSLPLRTVDTIAQHLQVQAANVYLFHHPNWASQYKDFWKILNRNYTRSQKQMQVNVFLTRRRSQHVLAIAKPPNYLKDVYTEELGSQMNDSIVVQSWQNGAGGAQNMHCTNRYSVNDVNVIGVETKTGKAAFSSKEDHSKWYVTRHKNIFCFSSLNRMRSQMKRGGEITCLIDPRLAQLFRKSIVERNRCKNDKAE
uniref:Putative deoxyribonuclease ii n=1 Tax=Amblyomma cajennense TaxID=34607 RepID=A0A023FPY0_AMBCJ